jgi:hypothetical protein
MTIESIVSDIDRAIMYCMNTSAQIEFVGGKEPEDNIFKLNATTQSLERETFEDLLKAIADIEFPESAKFISVYRGGVAKPTLMSPTPWALFRIYSEQ